MIVIRRRSFIFQSTPSAGRATVFGTLLVPSALNFNPRPPRGGRPYDNTNPKTIYLFQSTPSAGRATAAKPSAIFPKIFQSTPSAGRATVGQACVLSDGVNFNPRPPRGGRLIAASGVISFGIISIHARGEGDYYCGYYCGSSLPFQSTPSAGRATRMSCLRIMFLVLFQSTPSAGRAT